VHAVTAFDTICAQIVNWHDLRPDRAGARSVGRAVGANC